MIKKADIVLFFVLAAIGACISLIPLFTGSSGSEVRVEVAGELYGIYDLDEDRVIVIERDGHKNKIIIKDGAVSMDFSDCANQICVEHKAITESNEQIVCLPNRVSVCIEGGNGGYDVISD